MSTTSSPVAAARSGSSETPLSVQRPVLSPRKRKRSAIEAVSPTSLDEDVTPHSSSRTSAASHSASCTSLEARVISPKKKTKAEDRSGANSSSSCSAHSRSSGPSHKWESHHVGTAVASALDLDGLETAEPIALWAEPAGDLSAAELELLCRLLA
ncbi:unnamed protein product [Hyaloperonospora brassicae]|uniref:RxLR effector candidate protein n=1 Tax=Hyaloperonospora brassicae TaxID=162125 RepID=A0AAV0U0D3_HYABA|nr:unnamed protein product [Hyaloperonospora brassicae]